MASAGYPGLHRPTDAIIDAYQANPHERPISPAEVSEGVQDVTCKNRVGLTMTFAELVRRVQNQPISKNATALQAVRARLDATVERANSILNG